jgi:hypothetical protein
MRGPDDDGVRVLGPGERAEAVVPGVDEPLDGGDEVGHGRKAAAAQRLAGEDREERLDQVQPRARGRGDVQGDPRVAGQPGAHRRVLVGGQVVDHHVQLPAGVGGGDLLEEGQNFWWRCRSVQASVTRPVATSRAANSVVVPCRT